MANREVSLFLKYPGPPVTLQRLQHSFLECVIEYKSGSASELQTIPPSQLQSRYQLKGTATLVDDELVIQFVPKHAGLHSVRIFSDTRELCRPIAFIINHNSDVETTPYEQPVKMNSSLFKSSPKSHQPQQYRPQQQTLPPSPQYYQQHGMPSSPPQQYGSPGVSPRESTMSQPQDRNSFWKQFPSDLSGGFQGPASPQTSPQHRMSANMARQSYTSSAPLSGRPISMGPADEAAYAGDLFTGKPEESSFSSLYAVKKSGQEVYGRQRAFMVVDHNRMITPDTFRMLEKDIDSVVTRGHKGKHRCAICSSKFKVAKLVELGEEEYCEACFKRQFLLRSAIEHFMVPSIRECTIEVPVNKKATKLVTARKTLPNLNLRGLDPNEIRFAVQEFRKFSPDENGWINKAVLMPLMKACFSYNLPGHEIKSLLSSEALKSLMTSFGLDERDEVHEIEFLALLAFVARERQRLKSSTNPNNKFTGADLQMAYAFQNQFGTQRQAPNINPQHVPTAAGGQLQPQNRPAYATQMAGSSRFRTSSAPPQGFASQVPFRKQASQMQQQQYRESQMLARESTMYSPAKTAMSPIGENDANPLFSRPQGVAPISPVSPPALSGFRSKPPSQYDFSDLQQPQAQFPHEKSTLLRPQVGGGVGDLPEEDQDDLEMPTLPPNKDPSGQTISKPLLSKRPPNKQQMMEELKLTGGQADAWMMY